MPTWVHVVQAGEHQHNMRWTNHRKAIALLAVRAGILTSDQLEEIHGITKEELASWDGLFDLGNVEALRTTRLKIYRQQLNDEQS